MARLNVNPTRMELTRLKKRLNTATRGHKLLKDKQDELIRQFIVMVKKNQQLRLQMEQQLGMALREFALAKATIHENFLEELVSTPAEDITLELNEKNIMSVPVPVMDFDYNEQMGEDPLLYGYLNSNAELDASLENLTQVLPNLLELTQLEKTCQLLADEIEKTRRRVNALEYLTIPQLEETIYYIKMKLEENERANITRLIKVKDFGQTS